MYFTFLFCCDKIEKIVLIEKFDPLFEAGVVECVEDLEPGIVLRVAGTLMPGAAKLTLCHFRLGCPTEGDTDRLKPGNRFGCLTAHGFYHRVIAKSMSRLDRIGNMRLDRIFPHISQCCIDSALCHRSLGVGRIVFSCDKHFGTLLFGSQCSGQAGAPGTDDENVGHKVLHRSIL